MNLRPVNSIIERYGGKRTALINILHDVQDQYSHLPKEALKTVAQKLRIDLPDIYGVATFYKSFSLIPKGKHSLTLCHGTACHVREGVKILREIKRRLNIEPGQTTGDGQISLNVVNCLGVCAIGPVMVLDGKFYGEMNALKARKMVEKILNGRDGGKYEKN